LPLPAVIDDEDDDDEEAAEYMDVAEGDRAAE
jgi:hypothetical protein